MQLLSHVIDIVHTHVSKMQILKVPLTKNLIYNSLNAVLVDVIWI